MSNIHTHTHTHTEREEINLIKFLYKYYFTAVK